MSRPSTLHKPPWTSKVSPFLYLSPIPHPLDGILRYASSLDDARVTTTSMSTREDGQGARGMEPVKAEAWKRRRKKSKQFQEVVVPLGQAVLPPARYRHHCLPRYRHHHPSGVYSGTTSGTGGGTNWYRERGTPQRRRLPRRRYYRACYRWNHDSGASSGTACGSSSGTNWYRGRGVKIRLPAPAVAPAKPAVLPPVRVPLRQICCATLSVRPPSCLDYLRHPLD